MKQEFVLSFIAAVVFHSLVLFVVRVGSPAKPLALSDEPSAVDVSLVEGSPAPPAPAPPAPQSEPADTPEPQAADTPPPVPEPTPDMSTPPPAPQPTPEEAMATPAATPVPQPPRDLPKPRPQERHSRRSTAASSGTPGTSTMVSNAGTARGVPGGGNGPIGARASYRSNPKPEYPVESLQQHEEGLVILSVDVSADGRPSNVALKRSSGYALLDDAAIKGVRRWTFDPARAAGIPVSSHVDVPVRFSLSDRR